MPAFYRVRKPMLVVLLDQGKPGLLRVDTGTVLRIKSESFSGKEIECAIGRRRVSIFRIDLEERAERLSPEAEAKMDPTPTLP
jgi:hypothetical protein